MIYIMIEHTNPVQFVALVNDWVKKGFRPLGGVSTNGRTYAQSMVKEVAGVKTSVL